MNKLCISLILFGVISALADEASDFCSNGPPGRYCTFDLTAYYNCTGQAATTIQCPEGTQCACFYGPSCSNVELVGPTADPCQPIQTLPLFPSLLQVFLNSTITVSAPEDSATYSTYYQIYSSPQTDEFRADIVTENRTEILSSDYYYGESSGNLHYAYDAVQGTCTADNQPIPFFGIPSGYRYYNSSTYNGEAVDIYYFRAGGQNNGEDTTYAYYITTKPDSNGFVSPILNYGFLNSPRAFRAQRINSTYSNAVVGPKDGFPSFPASTWNPPAICLSNSSSTDSTSGGSTAGDVTGSSTGYTSTGDSSTGSPSSTGSGSTTGDSSCSDLTRGHMRCFGNNTQYQVCDHGFWQAPQTCQLGLVCKVSGVYIYCVRENENV